jgi:hypothetical protein
MPHYSADICTKCGQSFPKDLLTAKIISFSQIGPKKRVLKSRTVAWLCPEDLKKDEAYNLEPHKSPGMRSPGLEHVRAIQAAKNK